MFTVGFFLSQIVQVLALPGLVWKQLTGEAVSWSKDFPAVDSVLVRIAAPQSCNINWKQYYYQKSLLLR